MSRKRRGFTLIELMVTVMIMGVLAKLAIPQYRRIQCKAKQTEGTAMLKSIYMSERRYMGDYGLYVNLTILKNAHAKALPLGVGTCYAYTVTNTNTTFTAVAQDSARRIRPEGASDIWRITEVANSLTVTSDACR